MKLNDYERTAVQTRLAGKYQIARRNLLKSLLVRAQDQTEGCLERKCHIMQLFADCYIDEDRYEAAECVLRMAMQVAPLNSNKIALARVLIVLGRIREAVDLCGAIIADFSREEVPSYFVDEADDLIRVALAEPSRVRS